MGENRTWDNRLFIRCNYNKAKRASNYDHPEGGFTVLGTTCFLNAPELSLKFLL